MSDNKYQKRKTREVITELTKDLPQGNMPLTIEPDPENVQRTRQLIFWALFIRSLGLLRNRP
jgi:hypothetical protein